MNYFGIAVIVFSTISFLLSWKLLKKEKYKITIFLLVIGGLFLRIYTSTDLYLHEWDERYHALVAKNIISHPLKPTLYDNPVLPYDYKNWSGNHIWVHKQPLPLWTMALSMRIFGVNEIALRLPAIIMTTIGIVLMFLIGSSLFNKKIGYLSALLYSINGLVIELTAGRVATDHIDVFFLFFIQLAVFLSIKFVQQQKSYINILVGIAIGAAILSKWLPALIVIPIWLLIVVDSKKFNIKQIILQLVIVVTVATIIFLPWQIYIFEAFPNEARSEANLNIQHLTHVLDGRGAPFYYFIDRIRINYGELIYIPLIWFIIYTFKNNIDKKRLAILVWTLVPLVFFSIAKTKMQGYILFICPALFIITADFWYMMYNYSKNNKYRFFISLFLILMIALPVRYTIERVKPFENINRKPAWVTNLKDINNENIKNGIILNCDKYIEAMFYTDMTAYGYIPNKSIIMDLKNKGYTIIINDNGKIPEDIRKIDGVIIREIVPIM